MYILIAVTELQDKPESNEKRTLQEIFYKECCSNNWFRNTLCHCYYCAGACISALSSMLLHWSDDFFLFYYYYYLQLSQFSLKPAVMVSGVIGSIPCGHSPVTSGQNKTMTSDCKASGHKALISLDFCSFSQWGPIWHCIFIVHFCIDESRYSSLYLRRFVIFYMIALIWLFVCLFCIIL